mmetsp:Transcript_9787/g.13746  ORF Transcript_9787/g.13746 Transcript_9787/m.13746 type:complete len:174 (-) Transcript_9787:64-585(-)
MPRYYCDYCGTYLTHDSAPGRRQHMRGWKHRENVQAYYDQFKAEFRLRQQQIAMMMPMGMPMPPPPFIATGIPPSFQTQPPPAIGLPPTLPSVGHLPQGISSYFNQPRPGAAVSSSGSQPQVNQSNTQSQFEYVSHQFSETKLSNESNGNEKMEHIGSAPTMKIPPPPKNLQP